MMRRTIRTGFLVCFLATGLAVFRSVSQKVLLHHLVFYQWTLVVKSKTHKSKLEYIYIWLGGRRKHHSLLVVTPDAGVRVGSDILERLLFLA
jgi:hypothetical protein